MNFTQSQFITSALHANEFPQLKLSNGKVAPEIAFVGRSNAGKSSFINALLQTKKLAKTSSTPGKTQRINFFLIDQSLLFVDLPGYGYAKAPNADVQEWSTAIDAYLNQRPSLKMVFLILDIRREPSAEDLLIAEWATAKQMPLFVIFTKRDKLSSSQVQPSIDRNLAKLGNVPLVGFLAISNNRFTERRVFIQMINKELATWV